MMSSLDSAPYEIVLKIIKFAVRTPADYVSVSSVARTWHVLLRGHRMDLTQRSRYFVFRCLRMRLARIVNTGQATHLSGVVYAEPLRNLDAALLPPASIRSLEDFRVVRDALHDVAHLRAREEELQKVVGRGALRIIAFPLFLVMYIWWCIAGRIHVQVAVPVLCLIFFGQVVFIVRHSLSMAMVLRMKSILQHRALDRVKPQFFDSLVGSSGTNHFVAVLHTKLVTIVWLMVTYFGLSFVGWIFDPLTLPKRLVLIAGYHVAIRVAFYVFPLRMGVQTRTFLLVLLDTVAMGALVALMMLPPPDSLMRIVAVCLTMLTCSIQLYFGFVASQQQAILTKSVESLFWGVPLLIALLAFGFRLPWYVPPIPPFLALVGILGIVVHDEGLRWDALKTFVPGVTSAVFRLFWNL